MEVLAVMISQLLIDDVSLIKKSQDILDVLGTSYCFINYRTNEISHNKNFNLDYLKDETIVQLFLNNGIKDYPTNLIYHTIKDAHGDDVSVSILKLNDNVGMLFFVSQEDIKNQKIFENDIYKMIINNSYTAFVMIDNDNKICEWNKQAQLTFGYSRDEIIDQALTDTIVPPQFRQSHLGRLKPHEGSGPGSICFKRRELSALHKDGHEFPIEITVFFITKDTNNKSYYGAFIQDITQRHNYLQKIENLNNELLISNKHLEQFAMVAAHDLKQPLRTITCYAQLLQDDLQDKLNTDQAENFEFLIHSANQLQSLVNDLLEFCKIENLKLNITEFSLDELVHEIIKSNENFIKDHKAKINFHNLPNITADKLKINSLLTNFIINGIKFNKSPKPIVEISCLETPTHYSLTVSDNGIGINEKYLSKIFNLFYRLNPDIAGSGIGLSVCQRIAVIHGGNITVESKEGVGSSFTATLSKNLKVDINV